MTKGLLIGESYEMQTKDFHRIFIGRVKEINPKQILVKIEQLSLVDSEKLAVDSVIEVERLDVKRQITDKCFFS